MLPKGVIIIMMVEDTIKKYSIFQEGDDLLLVVDAPAEQFDDEVIQDFWDEIHSRGFDELISCDVEKVLLEAERGEVVRIGGAKAEDEAEENDTDDGARVAAPTARHLFEIEIHRNNLVAILSVKEIVESITEEQVYNFLAEIKIIHGIIEENVETLAKKFPFIHKIKIAEGTPPTHGKDAKIKNAVEIKTDLTPTMLAHGQVDFKQLNLILPVKTDDVIQTRTPPTPGEPGTNIFGEPNPGRDGKDMRFKKGRNTEISEDGRSLIALEDGYLFVNQAGAISVLAIYIVEGNVDYHTGIIEYKGDVVVQGDVLAGFNIYAGGDIFVNGSVEDCILEARGNIEINGGIRSSGNAVIKSGGNIQVNFAENVHIEAAGNIRINREAINCEIIAGGDVEVLWVKGRLIGGGVTTGGWISAAMIGAAMEGHLQLAFEPGGWEPHFTKITKIDGHLANVSKNANLSDHEKAEALEELINERVSETGELDDLFVYSFATAHKFQPPIHLLFGKVVYRIITKIGPATIVFTGLEAHQDNRFVNAEQREKLRRKRKAELLEDEDD